MSIVSAIRIPISVRPELVEACPEFIEGGEWPRSCFDRLGTNGHGMAETMIKAEMDCVVSEFREPIYFRKALFGTVWRMSV